MPKKERFLKISSVITKIAAWIFLLFGIFSAVSMAMNSQMPINLRVVTALIFSINSFFIFFFLWFVTKIADAVVNLLQKESK
ncbi:MAG: hypothetical protein KKC84_00620 [Candidatus Omnitrophica bacterium]|nr:hypothetical protein [Candidatus Omnitrophota bacterium]